VKEQCLVHKALLKTVANRSIVPQTTTETSVTLDGIKYVVDCGKHKSREYSSSTGMESLKVSDISKAQVSLWMKAND
jgi:HrpA-like RNA helicase